MSKTRQAACKRGVFAKAYRASTQLVGAAVEVFRSKLLGDGITYECVVTQEPDKYTRMYEAFLELEDSKAAVYEGTERMLTPKASRRQYSSKGERKNPARDRSWKSLCKVHTQGQAKLMRASYVYLLRKRLRWEAKRYGIHSNLSLKYKDEVFQLRAQIRAAQEAKGKADNFDAEVQLIVAEMHKLWCAEVEPLVLGQLQDKLTQRSMRKAQLYEHFILVSAVYKPALAWVTHPIVKRSYEEYDACRLGIAPYEWGHYSDET